jgi:hypothetical protein
MSLHPRVVPEVPEETAIIAHAAFPKGNTYMRMRDELGLFSPMSNLLGCMPVGANRPNRQLDWPWRR